jgi:hypothetical protein
MPPQDPTPLGDAMTHRFPEQKIPQPKPGAEDGDEDATKEQEPDVSHRPPIPEGVHPPGRQRG